jgi:transcriptional regulator with XRE-family HTH domain
MRDIFFEISSAAWRVTISGLVAELAQQRQAAGVSQTEIAARMGTSQSAVARLEAGEADVRASTLERYAAAVGGEISWRLEARGPGGPAQGGGGA